MAYNTSSKLVDGGANLTISGADSSVTTNTSLTANAAAAGATITIFTGKPSAGQQITLISTDNTSKTYTAVSGNANAASNQFSIDNNFDDVANSLETAIEHASGHNGKILVSRTSNVLSLTQSTTGTAGNTTITSNLGNVDVDAKFVGGSNGGLIATEVVINTDTLVVNTSTASGKVGIGETTPLGTLHVKSADSGITSIDDKADELVIEGSGNAGISILGGSIHVVGLYFPDSSDPDEAYVKYDHGSRGMAIRTAGTDALTIDSSQNVTIAGSLTVNGTVTSLQTTNTLIKDTLIELANGASTGSDSGIIVERGSTGDNAILQWDESGDVWVAGTTTATGASTGDLTVTAGNLAAGKIGAGTVAPDCPLDVNASNDLPQAIIRYGSSYKTDLLTTSNGTFRITPTARTLQVDTGNTNGGNIQFTKAGGTVSGAISWDTGDKDVTLYSEANLYLGAGGSAADLTLNADGTANISGLLTVQTGIVPDAQDGAYLGTSALQWSDLFLADSAVISLGDDNEVTLTHVPDTGILLNSTNVIQFNDASQNIGAPNATTLDINATDEIELNATLIDVNGNLDVSGTYTGGGLMTTGGNIVIPDAGHIGSASDTNAITISSGGVVAITATTASSAANNGALTVAGGVGIAADLSVGDDLRLITDDAVLSFGASSDVTLTHVANTGLTLNSTNKLCFNDASQFIQGASATVMEIGATDEIGLTATLVDMDANLDLDGTANISGLLTIQTGIVPDAQDGAYLGTSSLQWSDLFLADGAVISFGDDNEITLTHVADDGLILKHVGTGDGKEPSFSFHAGDNDIAADDVLGSIFFKAPDEGAGTDAILVAAGIEAVSEGDFSSSNNATKLSFKTGASEAATEKVTISSAGDLSLVASNTELRFYEGSNYVGFEAPALSGDQIWVLPAADGNDGEQLTTDGSGNLSWAAAGSGGGGSTAADDISAGDAAVNLTTTTGNITIDAQANDSDIIFKGTDDNSDTTFLTIDGSDAGTAIFNHDIQLDSDAAILAFGDDQEITVTHVHDVGLTITNTVNGTDDRPVVLQLKSEEDAIVADDVIGSLEFAAGDSDGTDGATVAAGIHAIAEGTFSASANATKLVFTTGVSETAAASATAKMTLSSAGLLTIADDLMIKDGGTIGVASTNDAMTISSGGIVTFKDDIIIKDGGTIGSASDVDAISIASDGKVTFTQDILLKDGVNIGSASDPNAIGISSGGVVSITATTASTAANDGALTVAGGVGIAADLSVGDDLRLTTDSAVISLGADNDATLTHDGTTGLTIAASPISIDSTGALDLNSTTGDINFQDGGTNQLSLDLDGTAGEVIMKLMVDSDDFVFKQYDGTEVFRVEDNGDFDIAGGAGSTGVTVTAGGQITADGRVIIDDTTNATSTTDGSLQTDGGLSVALDAVFGDDVFLLTDSAELALGADKDAKLIHDGTTGLTISANPIKLDSGGAITLDSETGDIDFQDGGTSQLTIDMDGTGGAVVMQLKVNGDDFLFKQYDGTEVIRFTDGGHVEVGDNLSLKSDGSIIKFGANSDITLTHVHDTGLTLESEAASTPVFEIKNTNNGGTAGILKFNNTEGGNDGADGDDLGSIQFWGNDDGTPSAQQYAGILAEISDASSGAEGGKLSFQVAEHDGTVTTGLLLQDGNADGEIDVTIGAGADSLTTISGDLDIPNGGFALGSDASGDMYYRNSSGVLTRIPVGSDNHVLTLDGAVPGWEAASATVSGDTFATDLKIGRDSQNLIDFATTDNKIILRVNNVDEVELVENALTPVTSDGVALGTSNLMWSDLFVASGGVLNFNNGDMTVTHSSNTLTVAGGTLATAALTASTGTFSGILKTDDATDATSTTDGSLQTDGGLSVVKDAVIGNDLHLLSDSSVVHFGTNSEITLTHEHNVGLILTHTATGDNTPVKLTLKSEEDAIINGEVIGAIDFKGGDSDGTDTVLVCAGIEAVATDTHAADNNAAKLSFKTGASEAAAEKMALTSGGDLNIVTDGAKMKFGADGEVTLTHVHNTGLLLSDDSGIGTTQLQFGDSGTYIQQSADGVLNLAADGSITFNTDTATFTSANANDPQVTIKNTANDDTGPMLILEKDRGSNNGADNDVAGQIQFIATDDASQQVTYGVISVLVKDASNGAEGGELALEVASHNGTPTVGLKISDGDASGEVDVTLGAGTSSVTNTSGKFGVYDTAPKTAINVINDYNTATFENQLADGEGGGRVIRYSPGADDTLTVGQLYFLHTDGTWDQTDADAVATGATQLLGVGMGSARSVGVLMEGFIRIPSTEILNVPGSGAVDGLPLYVSTTAGHFDFNAPGSAGDYVRIVGHAIDDDSGDVLIYFNPSNNHVEL